MLTYNDFSDLIADLVEAVASHLEGGFGGHLLILDVGGGAPHRFTLQKFTPVKNFIPSASNPRLQTPNATYRIQLNKDFGFRQARGLVPQLAALGITHLYLSPIFQARKGSMHGYDVTDPTRLNEELGDPSEFDALAAALTERGMGIILDIVPNHMAASPENPWWMDVLEKGPASPYAAFFDVEWGYGAPEAKDKIYLPILGEPYAEALEGKKLTLLLDRGCLFIRYYETDLPVAPAAYHDVLTHRLNELLSRLDPGSEALHDFGLLLEVCERLPGRSADEWEALEARRHDIPLMKERLNDVYTKYPQIGAFINDNLRIFNGTPGDPASFDRLDAVLEKQAYELAYWRVAREKINYRRFFDVTDLIGIRAQDPQVFEATHALAFQLLKERKVAGFRIDHVDGLSDPSAYLARLQERAAEIAGEPVYIVVEKILCDTEKLPNGWPVAGTTGYDFLGVTNNVFVEPAGLKALQTGYEEFTGNSLSFYDTANVQKRKIMTDLFVGEMGSLAYHAQMIGEQDRYARDLSPHHIRRALTEITISMPVYRTYVREMRIGDHDAEYFDRAVNDARRRNPQITPACFDFLARVLHLRVKEPLREQALPFIMRWQQLTGPIMAKGVEDTTLYVYNRLLSMNDVGGSPEPVSLEQFHAFQADRAAQWPATMNCSSTHDTKRSEGVRARLNVLSEIPEVWMRHARRWKRWNEKHKRSVKGALAPDRNDEYLIYQTLLGAWPIDIDRLKRYLTKAAREAKIHTSWIAPDQEYEDALLGFAGAILDSSQPSQFLSQFLALQNRIAFYGAINCLSQTLLKMTAPGIPDFYQGTTRWDLRLVDPDNREAPDAADLELPGDVIAEMLENWQDGRVKTWLIGKTLCFRKRNPRLFNSGQYIPLAGRGRAAEHAVAFVQRHGDLAALVIVPRFIMGFSALEKYPLGRRVWQDAHVVLPPGLRMQWKNNLTGDVIQATNTNGENVMYLSDALRSFPVALLSN